jgi:uroporphyrinogen decarboxylase
MHVQMREVLKPATISSTGTLTPRERAMVAFKHQIPDLIPAYVRNIEGWERHADWFGVKSLSELMDRLGNTIVSFVPGYRNPPIAPKEHAPGLPAIWGIAEELKGTYTNAVPRPLANAETIADVDAYPWPSGSKEAWDFDGLRTRLLADTQHARLGPSWMPVFSRLSELFGMEQAMINLRLNRPVIEAALAHLDQFYSEFYTNLLDTCGDQLEIFGIGDDFAGNRGLLIRPADWRALFKPLYGKWLGLAKSRGLVTQMHSCGLVKEVLPDLIDAGLDAWQTVQTHLPGQEPARIKAEFGKNLILVGAVNTTDVLGTASPDQVREHVLTQIRILAKDGGYICGPDHIIMQEVPSENIQALYETIAQFRGPGYTSL